MHTPLAVRVSALGRKLKVGWLGPVILATMVLLGTLVTPVGFSGPAGATPPPTPAQAEKLLVQINAEATRLGQQYAKVIQQLVFANQWLQIRKKQTAAYFATVEAMRRQVAKLAVAAYEQGGINSPLALFLSASPQHLLDEASIVDQLSAGDAVQIRQYLEATRALLSAEQTEIHARAKILGLKHALNKRLAVLISLNRKEGSLLPLLTLTQLATSGHPYENPLREVSGLNPERADMGVDFSGNGPVYAIGAGVVTQATAVDGGWPGGGWITYQLTDGPAVGEVVYVAEDVSPLVQVGQKVTFGTVVGHMFEGGSGIETGWAMLDSASSESEMAEAGGIGGPGPFPTAIGLNFDSLLQALGVPAASNFGPAAAGVVPSRYQIDWARALR